MKDVNAIWHTDSSPLATLMLCHNIEQSPGFTTAKKQYFWDKHLFHQNPLDVEQRALDNKDPKPNYSSKAWFS
jgi:hypothetical protein